MLNDPPRIVIDTNLWISFLISQNYTKLNSLIFSGEVVLIFSSELLSEFISVTSRPKFRKYFSIEDVAELSAIMEEHAAFIILFQLLQFVAMPKTIFFCLWLLMGKQII